MALLGKAALAMWWDMAPAKRSEFEHWHSHEHFPERLGIPGFRRSARWTDASGGEGIFVMYELESHDVLSSAPYLERLNAPTPWSVSMMPNHRNMVRSQCKVLRSSGSAVARCAMTIRLSPQEGQGEKLRDALAPLIDALPMREGFAGAHLLQHEQPAIAQTNEQKLRGSDTVADWILVVPAYELRALQALTANELSEAALVRLGAAPGAVSGFYQLAHSATPGDIP